MDKERGDYLPNHGHTDRPCSIADAESEIRIVGPLVFSLLHVVYDLGELS
jgi:hypothetical protein